MPRRERRYSPRLAEPSKPRRYRPIPIAAAKDVAKKYTKDQVILITWDKAHAMMHVTTYGKTLEDCKQAAKGGNILKEHLGFPEATYRQIPARQSAEVKNLITRARDTLAAVRGGYPSSHLAGHFEDLIPKLCDALEGK